MTKRTELLNTLLNQQEELQIEYGKNPSVNVMYQLENIRAELKTLRAHILNNMPTVGMKRETIKKGGV